MSTITKIKKYRKTTGSILIAVGTVGSVLGVSMFFGGGLHGVGIPDMSTITSKVLKWDRANMGFLNFNETGTTLNMLRNNGDYAQTDESISFRNLHNLTKNKIVRVNWKVKVNNSKKALAESTLSGGQRVALELKTRATIDFYENLLLLDTMYGLSISGVVIMPISIIILIAGLLLWYSGIKIDKKQTELFLNNLEQNIQDKEK